VGGILSYGAVSATNVTSSIGGFNEGIRIYSLGGMVCAIRMFDQWGDGVLLYAATWGALSLPLPMHDASGLPIAMSKT